MKPKPSLTIGIEEEYQIIDPATRELRSFITQFIECVRQSPFYLVESSALTRHAEPPDAMDSR